MRAPRWFATWGPKPYSVAKRWPLIVAWIAAILVGVNTLVMWQTEGPEAQRWVNAAAAWILAFVLWLRNWEAGALRVARWRAQVRSETCSPDDEPPE